VALRVEEIAGRPKVRQLVSLFELRIDLSKNFAHGLGALRCHRVADHCDGAFMRLKFNDRALARLPKELKAGVPEPGRNSTDALPTPAETTKGLLK